MSDERDGAASDGGDVEATHGRHSRTALATEPVTRPQRPTGKRSRQRTEAAEDTADASTTAEVDLTDDGSATQTKKVKAKARKGKRAKKPPGPNPIAYVYNYLKQVVAELRKVIWPNRKQMITYTSVVLAFLAFMVALIGLADLGLAKLVMLVFG